jgi:uncharacterized membrane protein
MATKKEDVKKTSPKKKVQKKGAKIIKNTEEDKTLGILCYLGILFIIPLLLKPKSKFIKFHAKQGIILTIGWFVGLLLYAFFGLGFFVHIAIVVLSIIGIMNVLEGREKDLPIVGDLANKFNL